MSRKAYVGVTAAAIKGTLLDRGTIEKLAESTSLEELVNRLKGTSYSDALAGVSPPFSARGLELAYRERLADAQFQIMRLARRYDLI